jgi:hypothetical protein
MPNREVLEGVRAERVEASAWFRARVSIARLDFETEFNDGI